MKFLTLVTAFAASNVAAFPHMDLLTGPLAANALNKRQSNPPQGAGAMPLTPPPFDAKSQYVSNKGAHKVRHSPPLTFRIRLCSTCT